jgi:uncharacterized membrane protein
MEGVRQWQPVGVQHEGVGARFQVELGGLPVHLRGRLLIVEWRRPEAIGWATESAPVETRGRWTFQLRVAGTEVALSVTYRPPAGAIGNLLASGVEGIVKDRIGEALDRMKEELEG